MALLLIVALVQIAFAFGAGGNLAAPSAQLVSAVAHQAGPAAVMQTNASTAFPTTERHS